VYDKLLKHRQSFWITLYSFLEKCIDCAVCCCPVTQFHPICVSGRQQTAQSVHCSQNLYIQSKCSWRWGKTFARNMYGKLKRINKIKFCCFLFFADIICTRDVRSQKRQNIFFIFVCCCILSCYYFLFICIPTSKYMRVRIANGTENRIILPQATLWTLEWTLRLDEVWWISWTVTELMASQEILCPVDTAKAYNMFWIINKALIYWGCTYEFILICCIENWTKVNKLNHYIK